MLIILSPAKTLDESEPSVQLDFTKPDFLDKSERIIRKLNRFSVRKIKSLMNLSDKLTILNKQRYTEFSVPFTPENAKQSVLMFKGDVYEGLAIDDFSREDFEFGQKHLRILSGLYGALRPLDLIQPYRLEMGTHLPVGKRKNLYQFWQDSVTDYLNAALSEQGDSSLINLASNEYFKVVNTKRFKGQIISPAFKEERDGSFMMISFFAKKARGLLARYIIKNQLGRVEDIKNFDLEGYRYNFELSTENEPIFTRGSKKVDNTSKG